MQRVALLEQPHGLQRVVPAAGLQVGIERDPRRMDVARAGAVETVDGVERRVVLALLRPHLRAGHEARRLHRPVALGPVQPLVAPSVFLHPVRSPRADQRRDAGRRVGRLRRARGFLGTREASFEQASHGLDQRLLAADLLPPRAIQPHLLRKVRHLLDRAGHPVHDRQQDQQRDDEQVQRNVDAVRMHQERDVAGVYLQDQRDDCRQHREQQRRRQPAHRYRPGAVRTARTADTLSLMFGVSTDRGAEASCFIEASAAAVSRCRTSK